MLCQAKEKKEWSTNRLAKALFYIAFVSLYIFVCAEFTKRAVVVVNLALSQEKEVCFEDLHIKVSRARQDCSVKSESQKSKAFCEISFLN